MSNSKPPKIFSEKLNKIEDIEKRLEVVETKINQLINEITPILTSHANTLKELTNIYKNKS